MAKIGPGEGILYRIEGRRLDEPIIKLDGMLVTPSGQALRVTGTLNRGQRLRYVTLTVREPE